MPFLVFFQRGNLRAGVNLYPFLAEDFFQLFAYLLIFTGKGVG
jgi:hypothetical protein